MSAVGDTQHCRITTVFFLIVRLFACRKRRQKKSSIPSRDTFTYAKQYDSSSDISSPTISTVTPRVIADHGTGSCRRVVTPNDGCACAAGTWGDSGISTLDLRRQQQQRQPLEPSVIVVLQSHSPDGATSRSRHQRVPSSESGGCCGASLPESPRAVTGCSASGTGGRRSTSAVGTSASGADMAVAANPIFNRLTDAAPTGLSDDFCRRFVDEQFGAIVNPAFSWNLQDTTAVAL